MSEEKKSIWSVTILTHGDDYKPHRMGTSTDGPYLFRSERQAKRWLRRWLMKWCRDEILENLDDDSDDEDSDAHEYNKICDSKKYEDVKKLAERLSRGEFISARIEWEIKEVEFCDDDYKCNETPDRIKTKKDTKKRKREDKAKKKQKEKDESKEWCTSCLHTVKEHGEANEETKWETLCTGCGGNNCPLWSSTLKEPKPEDVAARQTEEAKQRRLRQCEGEELFTDEESNDDEDEKPQRKKAKSALLEAMVNRSFAVGEVVQTSDAPGAVLVHAQGDGEVQVGSGPVQTGQSADGTPIVQRASGPGSVLVCATGNARIVM